MEKRKCEFCDKTAWVTPPEDTPEYPAIHWVWICDECLGLDDAPSRINEVQHDG